jgi:hypothetical protein
MPAELASLESLSSLSLGWGAAVLGLAVGMRHALEPDHLAAVGTLVAERPRARGAALVGASWGLGHSLALCAIGGLLLALRVTMPPWLEATFEGLVAVMLVALGGRALVRAVRLGRSGQAARTSHQHGHVAHAHDGPMGHLHLGRLTLATRPLLVGLVHGVAGSGALTALALAATPSVGGGLLYMACFAIGSILGMATVTTLSALSARRLASHPAGMAWLAGGAGALSLVVGVIWGARLALA